MKSNHETQQYRRAFALQARRLRLILNSQGVTPSTLPELDALVDLANQAFASFDAPLDVRAKYLRWDLTEMRQGDFKLIASRDVGAARQAVYQTTKKYGGKFSVLKRGTRGVDAGYHLVCVDECFLAKKHPALGGAHE